MLVLSRKQTETIVLQTSDGPITITVIQSGNKSRLGIDAPRNVLVVRGELLSPEQQQVSQ